MKKIVLRLFIIATTLGSISSCNFLDLKPVHEYVDSDMLKSYEDAQAAVNGVYTNLLEGTQEGGDEYAGANFLRMTALSGFIRNDFEKYYNEEITALSDVPDIWKNAYKGINYANFAINGISSMEVKVFKDEKTKNSLIAEARLLRAWYYLQVLYNYTQWWAADDCKDGIVYRDKVSALDNLDVKRSTVGESYTKIIADLDFAIEYCPTLDEFGSNRSVSKEYAKVLKAKLLLIRGTSPQKNSAEDLSAALTLVNDVLTNKPKNWVMENDMSTMYLNSFDSKENLFVRYNQKWKSVQRNGGYVYGYGVCGIASRANNEIITSDGKPYPYDESKFDAGFMTTNLAWIKGDPRWKITTGLQDNAETWDVGARYCSKKLYRNGYNNIASKNPKYGICDGKFNVYYFRLYELYLMKAELILRTGGTYTEALQVVNSVRAMRTNPILPALSATSEKEVYDIIFKEIFNELHMENGSEYFASLRFISPDGDRYIDYNKKTDNVVVKMLKHILPIPAGELSNNKLVEQTEGY